MKQMTDISKILFIGTIPTINISEPVYVNVKSGWNTSPSYSVFGLVERFLANYHGEYWFVNYGTVGTHGIQVNHNYDQHTYTIDLRKPLTPEAIERFEDDIKSGRKIVTSDYIIEPKNYKNKANILGIKSSNTIEKIVNKLLKRFLDYLNKH